MIIVGTGGLGLEILGTLINNGYKGEIVLYDENTSAPDLLFKKFRVIKKVSVLSKYIDENDAGFITGIGTPRIREKLTNKLLKLGGKNEVVISKLAALFQFNEYPAGTIIEPFAAISHRVEMGTGCAIHVHSSIGHSAKLGKYVNVGPGAAVIGPVEIDDYAYIGAHAVIHPHIRIGKNAIIAAGAVVKNDVGDLETVG